MPSFLSIFATVTITISEDNKWGLNEKDLSGAHLLFV